MDFCLQRFSKNADVHAGKKKVITDKLHFLTPDWIAHIPFIFHIVFTASGTWFEIKPVTPLQKGFILYLPMHLPISLVFYLVCARNNYCVQNEKAAAASAAEAKNLFLTKPILFYSILFRSMNAHFAWKSTATLGLSDGLDSPWEWKGNCSCRRKCSPGCSSHSSSPSPCGPVQTWPKRCCLQC